MALTVAAVTTVINKRVGQFATIVNVADDEIQDAIGWAIRTLGESTADVLAVTDTDLSTIIPSEYDALLGLSELRTLETILQNYMQIDRSVQSTSESFDQLRRMLEKRIPEMRENIQAQYGHLLAFPLTADGAKRLFDTLERDSLPKMKIRNAGAFS